MRNPLAALLLLCSLPAAAGDKIIVFDAEVAPEAQARLVDSRGGSIIQEYPFINAALARFPDDVRTADLSRTPGVASAEDDVEIYWLASQQPLPLEAAQADIRDFLRAAQAKPPAASTQPVISPVYITSANVDGKFERLLWSVVRLGATRVWGVTKGAGARVAVLDSGVDCTHPDLAPNCAPGYNVLEPGTPPHDATGHGTHVAGIIAGALNWSGMAGLAPEATILPVKVLNSSGTGKVSQIIEGIRWAVGQKADILNLSLGAPQYSEAQGKAVKAARKAGVLVVCAAGNFGGSVGYPAAFEDAVAVTAIDYSNKFAPFSCRGPETDFTAPGVRIYSSYPEKSFYLANGTSQAAPHISGAAALAVSLGVNGEAALREALKKASYDIGLPPEQQGAGVPIITRLVSDILAAK